MKTGIKKEICHDPGMRRFPWKYVSSLVSEGGREKIKEPLLEEVNVISIVREHSKDFLQWEPAILIMIR